MITRPPRRTELRRKRSASFTWTGEELTLLPGRAVWWKRQSTVFIADPHFGKASTFRAAGIAVPELTHESDLVRLDGLLRKTRARRLVILGDFFHAKAGRTAATMDAVTAWRARHERLHIVLIRGNHDRRAGRPLPSWHMECVDAPWSLPPFQCWHEPPEKPDGFALAGHLHPSVHVNDRSGTGFGGACFHFGADVAVLPAFGTFTGGRAITAKRGDCVFLAGDDEVIDVTPLVTPRPPAPRRRPHRFARPAMMLAALFTTLAAFPAASRAADDQPIHSAELIFPLEHWHNHGSCVVEASNGDLIVCWFHGSGERTADDVKIEGARLRKGTRTWSERFTMADTPGYPDTNCCMFIDPGDRLWLLWPTILANKWESALMKYRISADYSGDGAPRWSVNEVMHVTPGPEFETAVGEFVRRSAAATDTAPELRGRVEAWLVSLRTQAADRLTRRIGWFTRAHPFILDGKRLIVPLYSDGFSFSLMNITDDWGQTWRTSTPLIGAGNIQPSIVQRKDGSLYTLMRDNGPAPKRLMQSESRDRGESWSPVTDSALPNPGSGAEITSLRSGRWILISNDTERGRHSLAVQLSDDEGKSWKWKRHLELSPDGDGRYHYPSIIQAKDGTLHASYSFHLEKGAATGADGQPMAKSIKHARFNEAWVMQEPQK